jgi:hypothetical protein
MTIKTLIKHGRSYALVIPRALMVQLGIEPDTPLKLSADARGIWIEPIRQETGPDYGLIRERRKFHVSLLRTLFSDIPVGETDDSNQNIKEIRKVAHKNVRADTAPLSKFEQSLMLEQVLDELLAFGPLTPFLNEENQAPIFMSFDYTFWSEGNKLPIVFDDDQHAEEILTAIKRFPHGTADDDGWVEFGLRERKVFIPDLLLTD